MSKKRNHNRTSISTLRIRAAYVGVPSEGVNRKDLARDLANWAMAKHQAERRKHALANPNSRAFKKAERAAAAELKYQSSKKAA